MNIGTKNLQLKRKPEETKKIRRKESFKILIREEIWRTRRFQMIA